MDTNTSPIEKLALIQKLKMFADVSPVECSAVVSSAHEKRFSRHDIIFFEGDPVHQVVMLLSGWVKNTQLGFSGQEAIIRLSGAGDVVGGFHLRANRKHVSTAQAVQSCAALVWQVATFEGFLGRFPTLRRNAVRTLEERLQEMEQRFREVSSEKVGSRLSSELIRLSRQLGCPGNENAEITLSHAELAQLTGMTLFTVSRLLRRWQTLGIVSIGRGAVRVRDFAALEQLSQRE